MGAGNVLLVDSEAEWANICDCWVTWWVIICWMRAAKSAVEAAGIGAVNKSAGLVSTTGGDVVVDGFGGVMVGGGGSLF